MRFLSWWTETFWPKYTPHKVPLVLLQREHFVQYRRQLIRDVSKGRICLATARKYLRRPIRWIEWLQQSRGRLTSLDLSSLTLTESESRQRKLPSHTELSSFLNSLHVTATEHPAAKIFFVLMVATGARPIEICNLTFSRIDDGQQSIMLQSKGGLPRWIPLSRPVWAVLRQYIHETFPEKQTQSGVVLRQSNGTPVTYGWARVRWRNALKYCGFELDGMMSLRHRFAPDCLEAGLDPNTTRYLLGHQDASHLIRYQHAEHSYAEMCVSQAFESLNWEGALDE